MNNNINHLIAKHGILKAFSIARKVSKTDIEKMTKKIKKKCKNKDDFNELLQEEILKTTKYSLNQDLIPGLIVSNNKPKIKDKNPSKNNNIIVDQEKTMKLNYVANIIAKKFVDSKFSKDEICYLILSLLSILGLSDTDFKSFHDKYNNENLNNDMPDDPEEGDDDFHGDDFDEI